MVEGLVTAHDRFAEEDREAIYRVIASRRDVRRGFLADPLPDDLLNRLLSTAHSAPSVGLMQPTRFLVIRDRTVRQAVHAAFLDANQEALASYTGERRELYSSLKLEGILEAPQNLCILSDPQSERGHRLGRQSMPETAIYSTVCAIQNLWLAARAEGVGVGWVSILHPERLRDILHIPATIVPVAYLCIGYVESFASGPELEHSGWERRVPLPSVVSYDRYSETGYKETRAMRARSLMLLGDRLPRRQIAAHSGAMPHLRRPRDTRRSLQVTEYVAQLRSDCRRARDRSRSGATGGSSARPCLRSHESYPAETCRRHDLPGRGARQDLGKAFGKRLSPEAR